jgi:hypothetical protein
MSEKNSNILRALSYRERIVFARQNERVKIKIFYSLFFLSGVIVGALLSGFFCINF